MFAFPRKTLGTTILSLLAMLAASSTSMKAQDYDLTPNYNWQPVKIGAGGWMRGLVIGDATHIYARADVDGLYSWDSANGVWHQTKITTATGGITGSFPGTTGVTSPSFAIASAPTTSGAGAIGLDPSDGQHVLVAYDINYPADLNLTDVKMNVYYSTNGGVTFAPSNLYLQGNLSQTTDGERLGIDPRNGNIAYFGTPGQPYNSANTDAAVGQTGELYRSLDGGVTWSKVVGGGIPTSVFNSVRYEYSLPFFDKGSSQAILQGQAVSSIVYITYIKYTDTATSEAQTGFGVLKSSDGGNTWTDTAYPGGEVSGATMDTLGNLYAPSGTYLYKYSRTGTAWVTVESVTDVSGGLAIDPRDTTGQQKMFAAGLNGINQSIDGGATWTPAGITANNAQKEDPNQVITWLRPSGFRPDGHGGSISTIRFDADGRVWAAGGNDGITRTTQPVDYTTTPTWASVSVGIEEMVAQPFIIPPANPPYSAGYPVLGFEDESSFTITDPTTFDGAQHFAMNETDPATGGPLNLYSNNGYGLSHGTDLNYMPGQSNILVISSSNIDTNIPLLNSSKFSSYSIDGGLTWNRFSSIQGGTHPCLLYGGNLAVSARGTNPATSASSPEQWASNDHLVWIPTTTNDNEVNNGTGYYLGLSETVPAPYYSQDGGATWQQTTTFNGIANGTPQPNPCSSQSGEAATVQYLPYQWGPWSFPLAQKLLVADPLIQDVFYLHLDTGGLWKSIDGGQSWSQLGGALGPDLPHHGKLVANPYASGDLWLVDGEEGALNSHGLYHFTESSGVFTKNPNFDHAWTLALGAPPVPGAYPSIYVYGEYHGDTQWGVFQSIDHGVTFNRISNYPGNIFDKPTSTAASLDTYGTVYLGFGGNSAFYTTYSGDTPNDPGDSVAPTPTISLADGEYPNGTLVTITSTAPEAAIIYTLDSSTPTESNGVITNGTLYTGPITLIPGTYTLTAISWENGLTDSNPASDNYTIDN